MKPTHSLQKTSPALTTTLRGAGFLGNKGRSTPSRIRSDILVIRFSASHQIHVSLRAWGTLMWPGRSRRSSRGPCLEYLEICSVQAGSKRTTRTEPVARCVVNTQRNPSYGHPLDPLGPTFCAALAGASALHRMTLCAMRFPSSFVCRIISNTWKN